MRKTAKILAGVALTIGATFAGTAAASAGGVPPTFDEGPYQIAGPVEPNEPVCTLTVPTWLLG